jgi:hypothetical protein
MKGHTNRFTTVTLSAKTSLLFILIFTTVIVFDSTIVKFSSYSGLNLSVWTNTAIFIIFSIVFGVSSIMLLRSVRTITYQHKYTPLPSGFRHFNRVIFVTQILTFAIILTIVLQMIVLNRYNIKLLEAQVLISHISALIFLPSLIYLFAGWILKTRRNYTIILYTVSFFLSSVNLLVSLLYLQSYFSNSIIPDVYPYSINAYVVNQPGAAFTESLSAAFDALSLSSFLLMWIATAIFLRQYRYKMGRIKYFSLMGIPLLYYIFPLQGYFGDVFFTLLQSSPVSYSILYIVIFSATKQVGAVLFSLAFWTASALVYNNTIRKSLLITSIGMAILFGTFELSPLQYHVYPPYGLITQAFIPLGGYLLLVGIFSSAKVISRDSDARKEFYKSASSQLSLLKTIGVAEMEKELEGQARLVYKRTKVSEMKDESGLEQQHLEEENIKEILHDVLNELYYSKGKKEIQDPHEGH